MNPSVYSSRHHWQWCNECNSFLFSFFQFSTFLCTETHGIIMQPIEEPITPETKQKSGRKRLHIITVLQFDRAINGNSNIHRWAYSGFLILTKLIFLIGYEFVEETVTSMKCSNYIEKKSSCVPFTVFTYIADTFSWQKTLFTRFKGSQLQTCEK